MAPLPTPALPPPTLSPAGLSSIIAAIAAAAAAAATAKVVAGLATEPGVGPLAVWCRAVGRTHVEGGAVATAAPAVAAAELVEPCEAAGEAGEDMKA